MAMFKNTHILIWFLILLLLQACTSSGIAPVSKRNEVKEPVPTATRTGDSARSKEDAVNAVRAENRKGHYVVKKGDTLYSIAWRYGFDYKRLASWNGISAPYTIYPGQEIRLKSFKKKKDSPSQTEPIAKKTRSEPAHKSKPKPVEKKSNKTAKKPATKTVLPKGPVKWAWPTSGKLVKSNLPTSKKGIDISGRNGQLVKAAAAGEVVYSGSGLIGYGKLIIIKHSETYLSAYAYNSRLLVKEGDKVMLGQTISRMGQDQNGRSLLHFEIRRNGKPVKPVKYLPEKRV